MSVLLEDLWKRGKLFLGSRYAILGGAMSWVSESNLVAAISNAGGFGVIATGAMPPEALKKEIIFTKDKTKQNFGVNLITMHPTIDQLIEVCIETKITHVILAGGLPKSIHINKLKEHQIKVLCFAPSLMIAKKLIKSGADALILEGMEAGGHIGPVSTSVLAQEILPEIKEVPIFIAGGIGRGEAIITYLMMGAAGCQLGTKFVCAEESIAHPNFKNTFIRANSRDAVTSIQLDPEFSVIPVRAIENDATKDFLKTQQEAIEQYKNNQISKQEAQLKIEHFWAGALKRAVIDGNMETGSIMAGQSVGMVKNISSTKEIIEELIEQAENFLKIISK